MARIVKKFGGTSLGDMERMRQVARKIAESITMGDQVVVVVSAMAGMTDHLDDLCQKAVRKCNLQEYDVVMSAGEQISAGLMAILLSDMGIKAKSWLGWQIPITTDDAHGQARIKDVAARLLITDLEQGIVPVIAGYQGVDETGRVSTLGRGGSDLTAVAVAAAIKADRCDIYTDVPGVYSDDPRQVSSARKLPEISYDEMLENASRGARVLNLAAIELARDLKIPLQVLSSFEQKTGTMVGPDAS